MRHLTSLVLAFSALSVSCAGEPDSTPAVPPLQTEIGEIFLEPCMRTAREVEYAATCGWLAVPENRSDPGSRLIQIPVLRVHATGDDVLEPIYYLAGGPGASNLSFSRFKGLIERHDLVFVGYRGADGPIRLDCPEYSEMLSDPPGDFLAQETFDASADAYRRCAERLSGEGIDLAGYTVRETIADLETARAAFGDQRVNTLSQSYGTRLAMLWGWLHPESINRSAMISVNPPGHFIWDPWVIDRQLAHYSRLCASDEECSQRTDDLYDAIARVSRDMPERWLFLPIKPGNIQVVTFMMLYHTTSAPQVFDAWLAADEGDPSGLALASLMADLMFASAPSIWGESVAKVTSTDYIYEADRDYISEFMPEGTVLGAPVSTLGFSGALGWPGNLIAEDLRRVQPSSVETLMISGNLDFSTPAEFARDELLPHLENGTQVILEEFGHTGDVWSLQPDATRHLLTTFFATGTVDDSRFVHNEVGFDPGLSLSDMAHLGLIVLILLALLLLLLARWLVQRLRRNKA